MRCQMLMVLLVSLSFGAAPAPPKPIPVDGEPCKGSLEIGGKTYKLQYAVAYAVKVFDDEGISVLFSEQPIAVEKLKTALRDGKGNAEGFFHFKPHVTVTFDKTGKTMFCNAWADNNSAGISGSSLSGELTVKGGKVRGKTMLVSDPESKRKTSFDVPFDLTLLVVPIAAAGATTKPAAKTGKPRKPPGKSGDAPATPPSTPIYYKVLPLPDDASEVEYKKLVGQIRCKSGAEIKPNAAAMTGKLEAQGWAVDGSDFVGPKSAILKRKRGDAELTIFIKPVEGGGSTVMIMSKGLLWEDKRP